MACESSSTCTTSSAVAAVVPWALLLLSSAVVVCDESLLIKPRKLALSTKMSAEGGDADSMAMKAENEIFMVRFVRCIDAGEKVGDYFSA